MDFRWQRAPRLQNTVGPSIIFLRFDLADHKDILKDRNHGRPQKFFQGGGKVDILLIFFRLFVMQRKWTYAKKKMLKVTATVAYSVFLVRKLDSEQMIVLVSMDFLRLS